MWRSSTTLRLAGAAVAFALLAAACGGGGAAGSPLVSPSAEDEEKAMLAFAQCMREQGIEIPDPTVDEDGNLGFRGGRDHEESSREDRAEAREACSEEVEGFTQLFDHEDSTEFQDRLLAYAACMRDNGIDMPDPDFSAERGGGQGLHEGIDQDDPDYRRADEICREEVFAGQGPGRGGH